MGVLNLIPGINSFFEMDEVKQEVIGDKTVVTFLTTGITPSTAQLKIKAMGLLTDFPPKLYRNIKVETLRANPISQRFKITAETPNVFRPLRQRKKLLKLK